MTADPAMHEFGQRLYFDLHSRVPHENGPGALTAGAVPQNSVPAAYVVGRFVFLMKLSGR